jgi:threonine dehydrogenase-like Zn-dependent dehydrogenase
MKALAYHGRRDVRVDTVPDPRIEEPTDAIVRMTTTAICGSDLHLYELLGPFIEEGSILGHEPMGVVDKQIQLRMGQANVKRWADDIMPLLADGDPLGVDGFHTHKLPLEQAPEAYEMFQKKEDGAVKVLLKP